MDVSLRIRSAKALNFRLWLWIVSYVALLPKSWAIFLKSSYEECKSRRMEGEKKSEPWDYKQIYKQQIVRDSLSAANLFSVLILWTCS